MNKPTAVIIKGNPKFINNNPIADNFYNDIKIFLESNGYEVSFDSGEPYTSPKQANLWIGHSRGVDRLKFAPKGTHVLMFSSPDMGALNHPSDNSVKTEYPSGLMPNEFHYQFTDKMKDSIRKITQVIKSVS